MNSRGICRRSITPVLAAVSLVLWWPTRAGAQSLGAGTLKGIVTDATGAALPSASIELANTLTGYSRQAQSGSDGSFALQDIPQNSYVVRVKRERFQTWTQSVAVRTTVPIDLKVQLAVAGQQLSVTVVARPDGLL
ncbi:MAG: TonB-dependent receptor plug, partial [Bryobacterales bacterium]|nr:TonB-dependent receptor plug [Bryobacterales bacterium]